MPKQPSKNDLASTLRAGASKVKSPCKTPLWEGPSSSGPNGGITFSLLSRFCVCRERFRLLVVEGLTPSEGFNHRIEYGNMWHVCEEALASEVNHFGEYVGTTLADENLVAYTRKLCKDYPTQQEQILHWYNVCRVQFPLYVDFWSKHPDVTNRTPLLSEVSFSVRYVLPSGRVVRLRGKWDSVDLVKTGKKSEIWLQENKTKGDIDPLSLQRQLTFDLQVMLYLTALVEYAHPREAANVYGPEEFNDVPIVGVRYNVIRRPLSGGRYSIVQHKPTKTNPQGESKESYYDRLSGLIENEAEYFFMRWSVPVTPADIATFRDTCLDPILEQLCDWWEWIEFITQRGGSVWDNDVQFGARPDDPKGGIHASAIHWRHPFGIFNPLDAGGASDVDAYLATGSEVGLTRTERLFPELASTPENPA